MAALTPPVKAAGGKARWVGTVTAYTLAGALTSVLVGATLGWIGSSLALGHSGTAGLIVAMAVALVAAARELGLIATPLPQMRRQTAGIWSRKGLPVAAVLWGLDLGLFATTWLTFAGAWLIPVLALLGGSPGFGAGLFAAYWMGRALSVWLAPMFMPTAADTPRMMDALVGAEGTVRLVHAAGLGWALVVLGVMAASSASL